VLPPAGPAAQTLVGEVAVTDAKKPLPPRFGSVATGHAVPFQCIAIGLSGRKLPEAVSTVFPTAHASVDEISTTPFRVWRTPLTGLGVAGLGLGMIVQYERSFRSKNFHRTGLEGDHAATLRVNAVA
jgi:hypothetical protein